MGDPVRRTATHAELEAAPAGSIAQLVDDERRGGPGGWVSRRGPELRLDRGPRAE